MKLTRSMKTAFIYAIAIVTLGIASCGNNAQNTVNSESSKDPHLTSAALADSDLEAITPAFTDLSADASSSIKQIVDHYISIQVALAHDDGDRAAEEAKAMAEVISSLDKSIFNEDQKILFIETEATLKEDAEHIAENAGDIKKQRQYFITMSENAYTLVKGFGAGRKLYAAHCPMVDNNTGARWLTEINEIKNPYYGASMLTCGSVDEVFNNL